MCTWEAPACDLPLLAVTDVKYRSLYAVGLFALSACAPETPAFEHARSSSVYSLEAIAAAPNLASDNGTPVLFRERPMASILDELKRHQEALEQASAGGNGELAASIESLVARLTDEFEGSLSTSYDALSPAQQDVYTEVIYLNEELRLLVARALTGSLSSPKPSPASRLS
jgi:hypothetical protein